MKISMDLNLTIDNFLSTIFGDVDSSATGKEKTILGMCFCESIRNKVYPAEFEANISKGTIKINPIDKPALTKHIGKDDAWSDGWLTWKHSLNDRQILHLNFIYRLSYLQHCYLEQYNEIQNISFSKNMNEYFNMSKEELQVEYNKIKVSVGGN